jgi:hypothetical protein
MDNAVRFVPFQGVTTEDLETTVTHLRRLITLQKYDLFVRALNLNFLAPID